jgi:hypothetical protein
MSSAKHNLVRALADLAFRHSAADWASAAENLEAIARLARSIAELDETKKKKNSPRNSTKRSSPKKQPKSDRNHSSKRLWPSSDIAITTISISKLREAAVTIGIKDEIAKTRDGIIEQIGNHLARLDSNLIHDKVLRLDAVIGNDVNSQQDNYDRWVHLITKHQKSS